jgi:hypothetical protein
LRRGQESNLPRLLRTDDGFEDREDHQAPFTLQRKRKRPTRLRLATARQALNVEHPTSNDRRRESLFSFFDRADDGVEVRPVAGIEFGMEQFAIGANFESAAARRNERERFDAFTEFKNFGRQTDGLRRVVSDYTIFDRDFGFHPARSFPQKWYGAGRNRSRGGKTEE